LCECRFRVLLPVVVNGEGGREGSEERMQGNENKQHGRPLFLFLVLVLDPCARHKSRGQPVATRDGSGIFLLFSLRHPLDAAPQ